MRGNAASAATAVLVVPFVTAVSFTNSSVLIPLLQFCAPTLQTTMPTSVCSSPPSFVRTPFPPPGFDLLCLPRPRENAPAHRIKRPLCLGLHMVTNICVQGGQHHPKLENTTQSWKMVEKQDC